MDSRLFNYSPESRFRSNNKRVSNDYVHEIPQFETRYNYQYSDAHPQMNQIILQRPINQSPILLRKYSPEQRYVSPNRVNTQQVIVSQAPMMRTQVVQLPPVTQVQIQEKLVEKPVFYEKQIFVEDRNQIDKQTEYISSLEKVNQDYYSELIELRNRPPIINEKVQYVEDTKRIAELKNRIAELELDHHEQIESVKKAGHKKPSIEKIQVMPHDYEDLKHEVLIMRSQLQEFERNPPKVMEMVQRIQVIPEDYEHLRIKLRELQEENRNLRAKPPTVITRVEKIDVIPEDYHEIKHQYVILSQEYTVLKSIGPRIQTVEPEDYDHLKQYNVELLDKCKHQQKKLFILEKQISELNEELHHGATDIVISGYDYKKKHVVEIDDHVHEDHHNNLGSTLIQSKQ